MTNYLIMTNGVKEHYFYRPYEGICMRVQNVGGIWQERVTVLENGHDGFGVYADKAGNVHLICVNNENKLVYAVRKNGLWKKYALSKLNDDIFASDMRLYSVNGRLNLLYSALYNGENLLIHCILGDHAKPSTVDSLESPHFFLHGGRVYYTNASGNLGYVSLADEKPAEFVKIYDDAHCGSVYSLGGRDFIVFTRESKLYIDGNEVLYDSRMETPFCVKGSDRLYIMWRSGSFVRYIASFNGGATWSEPMRFMSTGADISVYLAQQGENFAAFYGFNNTKEITLLGKPNVFEEIADYSAPAQSEIEKLRSALNSAQSDIQNAKQDIIRLNKAINKIKETSKQLPR